MPIDWASCELLFVWNKTEIQMTKPAEQEETEKYVELDHEHQN